MVDFLFLFISHLVWSCRENGPNATTKNHD